MPMSAAMGKARPNWRARIPAAYPPVPQNAAWPNERTPTKPSSRSSATANSPQVAISSASTGYSTSGSRSSTSAPTSSPTQPGNDSRMVSAALRGPEQARGPDEQDQRHEDKNQRVRQRRKEHRSERGNHADGETGHHGAEDGPQSADDDYGEHVDDQVRAHQWRHVAHGCGQNPCQRGQRHGEAKHRRDPAIDIDAQCAGELGFFGRGADHHADASPLDDEPDPDADGHGEQDDEQAVRGVHDRPQVDDAGQA